MSKIYEFPDNMIFPKLSEEQFNKWVEETVVKINTFIESTQQLYNDIDKCVDKLLQSRRRYDTKQEMDSVIEMESLMVATLQQLQCVLDHLKEK